MHNSSMQPRRVLRIAITAVTAAVLFFVSAGSAWAMTLTFVRHGQSVANAEHVINTEVPGPPLTELGWQEAVAVASELVGNGYDGIYASDMLRAQQTAEPLRELLPGVSYEVLPGLREISAGIFEGSSATEGLGRIGYALPPVAWTLGARFVPVLGAQNGNAFDARVDEAIQTIVANGDDNAVAFAHAGTIMIWTLMNVDNPDLGLLLTHRLGNTQIVVIEGSPDEGWTLVSWAGVPVSANPSLFTKLFVDVRDLIVAPQTALYNIGQAFATGNIAAIAKAVWDGLVDVVSTTVGFVPEVISDIVSGSGVQTLGQPESANPLTVDIAAKPDSDPPPVSAFATRTEDSESDKDSATQLAEKPKTPTPSSVSTLNLPKLNSDSSTLTTLAPKKPETQNILRTSPNFSPDATKPPGATTPTDVSTITTATPADQLTAEPTDVTPTPDEVTGTAAETPTDTPSEDQPTSNAA